jgi:hypothetical protein
LLLLFFTQTGLAQINISNRYFPSVGDTIALARASDEATKKLVITPSADFQFWNYDFLTAVDSSFEHYGAVPDSIKQQFPDADLMATIEGQQVIFNKTATRFEILGFKNIRFQNLFFNTNVIPDNPILQRRAELEYVTVNNNRSRAVVVLSSSQFPDSLVRKLPIRPDSVRISLTNIRQDYVDSWGSLTIPKATYSVLRVRCIEINEQQIEVKINGSWLDVTPQYFKGNATPQDTTITYNFWSEGIKSPILRLLVNNENKVTKAEYRIEPIKGLSISGKVRFWTGQGMPNVVVKIGNDSVKTDANGLFLFTNIPSGKNLPVTISKTDNYENGVDALDVLTIRRHIIGITDLDNKFRLFAADVNNDKEIDAADIYYMRRLILNIIDNFPNTTPWRFMRVATAQSASFPFSLNDTFPLILSFSNDIANFDFYAVKKGDIDGSARP